MEVKEVFEERNWEEFISRQPRAPFLQSWAWGEFQEKVGVSCRRFGLYQDGELIGVCQALVGRRKLGNFVYVPRGPFLGNFSEEGAQMFLERLKSFAREEKVDYLRVEPQWESNEEIVSLLRGEKFRKAQVATSQAGGVTLLLDLTCSEEELLAKMRKTTRYLIRSGEALGIDVERTSDPEMMGEFHRLMKETFRRQGFVPHPYTYLQTQFETLAPRRMAELALAKYKGDILSAAITISYGDSVSYVHGASIRSDVPSSYVLIWETIKEAKKDGYCYFDFWGVTPTNNPHHPWYGYSLFKRGFGGFQVDYVGVWDYPLTLGYGPVFVAEKVRRIIRRY